MTNDLERAWLGALDPFLNPRVPIISLERVKLGFNFDERIDIDEYWSKHAEITP